MTKRKFNQGIELIQPIRNIKQYKIEKLKPLNWKKSHIEYALDPELLLRSAQRLMRHTYRHRSFYKHKNIKDSFDRICEHFGIEEREEWRVIIENVIKSNLDLIGENKQNEKPNDGPLECDESDDEDPNQPDPKWNPRSNQRNQNFTEKTIPINSPSPSFTSLPLLSPTKSDRNVPPRPSSSTYPSKPVLLSLPSFTSKLSRTPCLPVKSIPNVPPLPPPSAIPCKPVLLSSPSRSPSKSVPNIPSPPSSSVSPSKPVLLSLPSFIRTPRSPIKSIQNVPPLPTSSAIPSKPVLLSLPSRTPKHAHTPSRSPLKSVSNVPSPPSSSVIPSKPVLLSLPSFSRKLSRTPSSPVKSIPNVPSLPPSLAIPPKPVLLSLPSPSPSPSFSLSPTTSLSSIPEIPDLEKDLENINIQNQFITKKIIPIYGYHSISPSPSDSEYIRWWTDLTPPSSPLSSSCPSPSISPCTSPSKSSLSIDERWWSDYI